MPAGNTFTLVESKTTGTNTSVSFNSLGSYDDLFISITGALVSGGAQSTAVRFNNDAGSNYTDNRLFGGTSTAFAGPFNNQTYSRTGVILGGGIVGSAMIYIPNYRSTTTKKNFCAHGFTAQNYTYLATGAWTGGTITSITFFPDAGGTFSANTRFSIYGLQKA